ncbi:MAG: energy transducer TonB [Gammaproteobacteria bacterium]|nr:MAG: energy transducer TonB [Gammaproteobacteria bacterium]
MRIAQLLSPPNQFSRKRSLPFSRSLLSAMLVASLTLSGHSFADNSNAIKQQYSIPTGPLGYTLSHYAVDEGLALSFAPALTKNLTSPAISGQYDNIEVIRKMLVGSGLDLIKRTDGSYTLVKKQIATSQQVILLPEVRVTGEKFDRSLQDTLSSVAVMTEENLLENNDRTLTDVMMRTPGVYSQSGNDLWGIRGIPASGFDDQGPVTINGAVSVYMDGVIQPQHSVLNNPMPLWDMGQIEIFRGAQSTVQGRNSLAGAIITRTNDPRYNPEAAVQVNWGNYGQEGVSLLAGGALIEDKVAGRLSLDYQEVDGYINNKTLNKDAFSQRNFNVRSKLLIQPTDKLDILVTVARSEYSRGENAVAANGGVPDYYTLNYDTDAGSSVNQNSINTKIDYYIDDTWSLTSSTSLSASKYNSLLDFNQSAADNQEVIRKHNQDSFDQEFRLAYDTETLRAHVGLYLNKITLDTVDKLNSGSLVVLETNGNTTIHSQALFGEVNWDFTDRWQLIAGLRYDHEKNESKISYPIDLFSLANASTTKESQAFNALLPKLGLNYQLAPEHLIGFVVQRGYRAGGVNLRPTSVHESYDPEFTNNYEFSYRGTWLNKRLRTNANVYYTDWKDQQIRIRKSNNFLSVDNAAESEMYGLELSTEFDVTRSFNLYTGIEFNKTEYKKFTSDAGNLSGESFLYAPKYKVSLGATYRYKDKLTANVNATYQDDSPSSYITNNSGQVTDIRRNDSVTLVNATLGYQLNKHLNITGYVKNMFNERYITNNQNDDLLDVGAPRMVGVALKVSM